MSACADELEQAETARGNLVDKYQIAACTLSGANFAREKAPLRDFILLVRLRNELVHLKPAWSSDNHRGRNLAAQLAQRGLTVPMSALPWLNLLETPKIADWACKTSRDMMLAVLDLTPDGNAGWDPFHYLKKMLKDENRFPP